MSDEARDVRAEFDKADAERKAMLAVTIAQQEQDADDVAVAEGRADRRGAEVGRDVGLCALGGLALGGLVALLRGCK